MPMSPHRPALAGFLLSLLALCWAGFAARDAAASQLPAGDLIVRTALADEGAYQGQCWPWVQRVVFEATGFRIGWDYREGFFEAGAVEVKLAEARQGDIVQIADDNNTAPDADYPGLHTAIVLENHGDGVLTVIDSNSQWDGIVRVRKGYTPAAAAARAGIGFHVYRFTGIPTPGGRAGNDGETAARVPSAEERPVVKAGDTARVAAQGDCLNLRWAPGTDNAVVACIPDRTNLQVLGEPQAMEGRYWVRVLIHGLQGYVAGEYLEWVSSPSVPASAASPAGPAPLLPFRAFVPMVTGD